ncbi:hypothetical protein E4P42_08400 [Mycobacterium sp. PS03-16]|uniref:hypothetical protein n=1 Tax=Mycobacterium sp. PS03-16 TaxID=2559611 RepID=UPI001073DCFA|nr:hypothetical protein [Mycobacterium sp. PS03-16]TFV59421.1 hypothetical protein E4P42_08400 [Mycobacterium sp. PS03-16]
MRIALSASVAGALFSVGLSSLAAPAAAAPTTTEPIERQLSSTEVPFTDRADIVNTTSLAFDGWSRLPETNSIRVYFVAGTPSCYGVHATTTETPDAVTVHLSEGLLPEAADRLCSAKAVLGATTITLDAPLGDRAVLSAS